jgi:hypothetical protein
VRDLAPTYKRIPETFLKIHKYSSNDSWDVVLISRMRKGKKAVH